MAPAWTLPLLRVMLLTAVRPAWGYVEWISVHQACPTMMTVRFRWW